MAQHSQGQEWGLKSSEIIQPPPRADDLGEGHEIWNEIDYLIVRYDADTARCGQSDLGRSQLAKLRHRWAGLYLAI